MGQTGFRHIKSKQVDISYIYLVLMSNRVISQIHVRHERMV